MKKRILINVNGALAAEIMFDGASLKVQGKLPGVEGEVLGEVILWGLLSLSTKFAEEEVVLHVVRDAANAVAPAN